MINIQTLVDNAVIKSSQLRSGQRDGAKFHVSDAGTCYRKRYLKRLGVEPTTDIDVKALKKMAAGDAGHEKLQALLGSIRSMISAEGVVETEHIKGHYDGVVRDGKNKMLVEIKTIEKWGMKHIKENGPKPEHLIQMATYWYFLRDDFTNLDQATIFYVKREDFEGQPYNFTWSDKVAKQVSDEWKPLIDYWIKKQVPPCTCDKDFNGNGIKYCRFPDGNGGCCSLELLKTLEDKKEIGK